MNVFLMIPLAGSLVTQKGVLRSDSDPVVKIYFASGCFWHVQHDFILAEQSILNRKPGEVTAVSGYAGGRRATSGRMCYHRYPSMGNQMERYAQGERGDADSAGVDAADYYSESGHTEAVYVEVPRSKVSEFAKIYFSRFINGDRPDVQDRGSAYRAAIFIPGGWTSPLLQDFQDANERAPVKLTLRPGKGSDPDTSGSTSAYVYDSTEYPFYHAELYHQFHDDMVEKYSPEYHGLKSMMVQLGKIGATGCARDGEGQALQQHMELAEPLSLEK